MGEGLEGAEEEPVMNSEGQRTRVPCCSGAVSESDSNTVASRGPDVSGLKDKSTIGTVPNSKHNKTIAKVALHSC